MRFGQVWLADLNPRLGTEPGKVWPVLILQDQALLDVGHPSTLVVPLTTNLVADAEPLRIRIVAQGSLERDSDLLVDQIRAVDNSRLIHGPLATVNEETLVKVARAVGEVLGIGSLSLENR